MITGFVPFLALTYLFAKIFFDETLLKSLPPSVIGYLLAYAYILFGPDSYPELILLLIPLLVILYMIIVKLWYKRKWRSSLFVAGSIMLLYIGLAALLGLFLFRI